MENIILFLAFPLMVALSILMAYRRGLVRQYYNLKSGRDKGSLMRNPFELKSFSSLLDDMFMYIKKIPVDNSNLELRDLGLKINKLKRLNLIISAALILLAFILLFATGQLKFYAD